MRPSLFRRMVPILALACLLAFPPAAAEGVTSGQLVARTLRIEQAATQEGSLQFLHVAQGEAPGPFSVTIAGRVLEGTQYDDQGVEATAQNRSLSTLRMLNTVQPNRGQAFRAENAQAASTNVPAGCILNVFLDGAATFRATLPGGTQEALARPELNPSKIQESSGDPSGAGPLPSMGSGGGAGGFWTIRDAGGPHVVTEAAGAAVLRLEGTFTLEVVGLDFRLTGDGGDRRLHSGTEREPLQPGAPGPAQSIRQSFLRINVTAGSLDLAVASAALIQWSGPAAATTTAAASMEEATGSVTLSDGRQHRLTGAAYHLDGLASFQANPAQQGLQLEITGLDPQGYPLAPASTSVRQQATPAAWTVAATMAGGACAVLLALLLRRRPTMADIEASLEAGRFRRAAWEASRLLRRRPGFEDAVLSRAIALSKLGRDRRVVHEVQDHLAGHAPSDGVLHYVLGLSLRRLGAVGDAQAALQEALRRTPALLPQVQPLLAGQQPSSPLRALPPAVDGPAYA